MCSIIDRIGRTVVFLPTVDTKMFVSTRGRRVEGVEADWTAYYWWCLFDKADGELLLGKW